MYEYDKRVEVFEVTERRDGCVWKTRSLGLQWVPAEQEVPDDMIYAPVSSSAPEALEMNIRRR